MRVVVTRSAADTEAYAQAVGPRVAVVCLPLLIEHPLTPAEQVTLAAAAARNDLTAVWIASARAVSPLVAALSTAGSDWPPAWTVGERTARAATAAGLTATSLGDDATTAATRCTRGDLTHAIILAPRSNIGRDDGLAILTAAGARVIPVVAYHMTARAADDPLLRPGLAALPGADACVVFSPSHVAALAVLVGDLTRLPPLIAIGPTTAAAIRKLGATTAAVATTPTPAGMAAALAAVYPHGHELS